MGVIETEYLEIREITKRILDGTLEKETAALVLKAYSEGGKRIDQYLKVVAMQINCNKASKGILAHNIIGKNIVSDDTAIDMDAVRIEEKIKCPEKGGNLINRDECLDYSGDSDHVSACQKCKHFKITRKRICPEIKSKGAK